MKSLALDISPAGTRLSCDGSGKFLISAPSGWPMLPEVDGKVPAFQFQEMKESRSGFTVILQPEETSSLGQVSVEVRHVDGTVDLRCEFQVLRDCELNALHLFGEGTGINMYDVVNFRNRHFTTATWPELLVGSEFKTETFSNDWQFAPHPTAMMLRKNELSLFAGFMGLQASFGMRMEVRQSVLKRWDVNFGQQGSGLKLVKGEVFRSARLRMFAQENATPHEMFEIFGRMLVAENAVSDPSKNEKHAWWREPVYCTWGDQWMVGNSAPAVSLADQTAASATSATEVLTEEFIWSAVNVIRAHELPIRTIVLDEGWAVERGDWRPHETRLPDLRSLVDRLHALDFKVMVWWNWAEIAPAAEVDSRFLSGAGWLNKHGCRWRDYSDPAVQEGYLKPLFRTFFSREPGCYDLDGVKTDFLADKVHPETPVADPSWRGEEVYFRKVTELFYREMRRHKPDAVHMGCAGNYWLAEFTDLNRTYDVHSSNWLEHEARARMLACTSPGSLLSYDMMTCSENTDAWFESARRLGAGVQIGNVLKVRDDVFSSTRDADPRHLALLREQMSRQP